MVEILIISNLTTDQTKTFRTNHKTYLLCLDGTLRRTYY